MEKAPVTWVRACAACDNPAQGQAHRCRSFLVVDAQSSAATWLAAGTTANPSSPSRTAKCINVSRGHHLQTVDKTKIKEENENLEQKKKGWSRLPLPPSPERAYSLSPQHIT